MNTPLQARQTWVNVITSRSQARSSSGKPLYRKSGMRVRTSGGIRLIGASLFLRPQGSDQAEDL